VIWSIPQAVSLVAVAAGVLLFALTLYYIDLEATLADASRLGLAFPLVMLPAVAWHLLRTWGWAVAFPQDARPRFTRLFRVRLAADAIGFFTVRGVAGDPLKVLLLYDRVKPEVTTASVALERLAFAIVAIVIAGAISYFAVARLTMPGAWDTVFRILSSGAVIVIGVLVLVVRRRSGDYLGRLVSVIDRVTRRRLEASRIVRFILDVEDVLLELLRGDRRRLAILTLLPVVCYGLMAFEVWVVLWAIGEPIGITETLTIETFARLGSVASAAIPGNLGALEASNAAPVEMLGLAGSGALALFRRIRALFWAGLGLLLYPRINPRRP
jgi:uncharacterized protein (TIRG00374 family)